MALTLTFGEEVAHKKEISFLGNPFHPAASLLQLQIDLQMIRLLLAAIVIIFHARDGLAIKSI